MQKCFSKFIENELSFVSMKEKFFSKSFGEKSLGLIRNSSCWVKETPSKIVYVVMTISFHEIVFHILVSLKVASTFTLILGICNRWKTGWNVYILFSLFLIVSISC